MVVEMVVKKVAQNMDKAASQADTEVNEEGDDDDDELQANRRNQALVGVFSKSMVETRLKKHGEVLSKERARIQAFEDAERKVRQEQSANGSIER